jgi:hypothetical protein
MECHWRSGSRRDSFSLAVNYTVSGEESEAHCAVENRPGKVGNQWGSRSPLLKDALMNLQ